MAYEEDKSIMRFRTYNPIRISGQFQKFAAEVIPYNARDEFAWQEHKVFITQDEIDAFLPVAVRIRMEGFLPILFIF
mgnify:CR=1 FL=1